MESDFLNRNLAQTPSNGDASVSLTRPTSKTALLVRQRRAMLEQLSCSICKGYLIDATTLDECMDSFCKSCIVIHLSSNNQCPKCGVAIQHRNPFDAMRPDRVLQEIVYKLVPGLYDNEMRRRREFYREHYGAVSGSSSDDDDGSSTRSLTIQGSSLSGERYGVVTHPKPFYKPSDIIDLSIEPQTRVDHSTIYYDNKRQSIITCFTGSLQRDLQDDGPTFSSVESQLFKTYLKCPARLTVLQLKKFIAAKFNVCRDDTMHLKYLNESLKDEYSLIDVAYIYDWRGLEHMQLYYVIERDLSKATMPNGNESDSQRRAGKSTRQSTGTSTQTVKRVCIDPQPKYYEEKNNNTLNHFNAEGRSMRPRAEHSTSVSKASRVTQTNPIIKAERGGNEGLNSVGLNGVKTGQQAIGNNRIFSTRQQSTRVDMSPCRIEVKEVRSLRSQVTGATRSSTAVDSTQQTGSIAPQSRQIDEANNNIVSRRFEKNIATLPQNKVTNQIVPYTGPRFTTMASSTQSSVVTMERIVEARSNQVITTVSSNTSASASYSSNQGSSSSVNRNVPAARYEPSPQLAFSFVTEKGITIVRRINNHDGSTTQSNASGDSVQTRPRAVSGTPTIQANFHSQSRPPTSNSEVQPSSSRSAADDGVSSRHQIKVKPVYKTLVDPTKLKSPNLKKLGFTARH